MWCSCIVLTFSYIHLSPLMGSGDGCIFPHHHSCCLLQWEGITSAKHTRAPTRHILLAAERPCLPFSPGVLCSHCLTGWLIWPKFSLPTSQVHSVSVCSCCRSTSERQEDTTLLVLLFWVLQDEAPVAGSTFDGRKCLICPEEVTSEKFQTAVVLEENF